MAYNLRTGLIGSGDIDVNVSLNNLDAANIDSGIFDVARIPNLSANKITSDILALDRIPTIDSTRVPNLSANKITSDILALARIPTIDSTRVPSLSANKITSDTLGIDRIPILDSTKIPNLDASKITSGTFNNVNVVVSGDLITTGTIPYQAIPQLSSLQGTLNISQLSNITANDYITIHGSKIDTGTITSQQLASNAVTYGKIATAAVGGLQIAANAVTADKIAAGSVRESGIANGAVTSAKLASGVLPEPGFPASTYRKVQILPSDFMRGGASSINLTSAEYPIDSKLKGIVYSLNGVGTIYAHVSIPSGYKAISLKIFALNMIGAQTIGTARNLVVEAYKVNMSYTSKQNLYYSSQYCNTENAFSTMDENMMPVNLTPTFDEESFLLIGVTLVSANPQPQGVYGGWVKIQEA